MADLLVYSVAAPAPTDFDVTVRELTVTVDGMPDGSSTFPGDSTNLGQIRAGQGSRVVVTLVDIDDAGNRSEPAVLEFVALDTLAPAKPGDFSVTLVAEVPAEAPVVEVPVVEVPVVEVPVVEAPVVEVPVVEVPVVEVPVVEVPNN